MSNTASRMQSLPVRCRNRRVLGGSKPAESRITSCSSTKCMVDQPTTTSPESKNTAFAYIPGREKSTSGSTFGLSRIFSVMCCVGYDCTSRLLRDGLGTTAGNLRLVARLTSSPSANSPQESYSSLVVTIFSQRSVIVTAVACFARCQVEPSFLRSYLSRHRAGIINNQEGSGNTCGMKQQQHPDASRCKGALQSPRAMEEP